VEIPKLFGCTHTTVRRVRSLIEEGNGLERKPGSGWLAFLDVDEVAEIFKANPEVSITTVAQDMDVSQPTMSRAVKKSAGTSLRKIERPLSSELQREKRVSE